MHRQFCFILSAMIFVALVARYAHAFDIGASITAGSGESVWYSENIMHKQSLDKDNAYTVNSGGGMVIDYQTPIENYIHRFNIALDYYALTTGYTQKLSRFNFDNTFCFALLKKDFLNLWLGPQIGIHYIFGKTRYDIYDAHGSCLILAMAEPLLHFTFKNWYNFAKYNIGALNLGLVLGINIITKKNIILSLSGGIKYSVGFGGMSFRLGGLFQRNYIIYGHGFDRFADFAILYRFDGV